MRSASSEKTLTKFLQSPAAGSRNDEKRFLFVSLFSLFSFHFGSFLFFFLLQTWCTCL